MTILGTFYNSAYMTEPGLQISMRTDPGRVRKFNEDSIAADARAGLMALADGLGPQRGAELAAQIATRTVIDELRASGPLAPRVALRQAIAKADGAIRNEARRAPALEGMASTLSMAWFRDGRVLFGHVGDSRIYRLRAGRLERMTSDHSFLHERLARGEVTREEVRISQSRQLVTRALGAGHDVAPDVSEQEVKDDDIYLLCSDGLHDLVADADIGAALEVLHRNLDLTAETLVAMANDRGGRDNISVVVARVSNRAVRAAAAERPKRRTGWLRSWIGR